MYFPYFRARPAERDALIDSAANLGATQQVHPVVEPWSKPDDLTAMLDAYTAQSRRMHLIVNPDSGDLRDPIAQSAWKAAMASRIADPALIVPTWKVTRATTIAEVTAFAATHPGRPLSLVVFDTALTPTSLATAVGTGVTSIFVGPTLPMTDFDAAFGIPRVIELARRFEVLTNKDYPAETTFSGDPKGFLVGGRQGFGDFTILKPTPPTSGGGGAGAVAVHMTYQDPATKHLVIQHFLSDDMTIRTQKDGIKLLQALEKLHTQQTVTTPGRFILTPGYLMLEDYRKRKHATTLGKSKQAQLSHHLSVVAASL